MFCFVFHFENMGNCILILTMLITRRTSYIISEFPKLSVKLYEFLGDIAKKKSILLKKKSARWSYERTKNEGKHISSN